MSYYYICSYKHFCWLTTVYTSLPALRLSFSSSVFDCSALQTALLFHISFRYSVAACVLLLFLGDGAIALLSRETYTCHRASKIQIVGRRDVLTSGLLSVDLETFNKRVHWTLHEEVCSCPSGRTTCWVFIR